MKRIMIIAMAVGCILVGTVSQGGALPFNQLTKDVAGSLCGAGGSAYINGCRFYMSLRLQKNKTPQEAASKATTKCNNEYGATRPGWNAKCKEGVAFLRGKE